MRRVLAFACILWAIPPAMADAPPNPFGNWRAVEIQGSAIDGVPVTLDIRDDGRVSGMGGCNRYSGKATVNENTLTFSPLASTKMACPPPRMEVETKYHAALQSVTGWRLDNGQLVLTSQNGQALVRLAPE